MSKMFLPILDAAIFYEDAQSKTMGEHNAW